MDARFIPTEFINIDSRLNQLSWSRLTEKQKKEEAADWLETHKELIGFLVNQYNVRGTIDSADDLYQEASIAAWEAFSTFDENRVDIMLETYLFVVMDNAIKDVFRKHKALKRRAQKDAVYFVDMANQQGLEELKTMECVMGVCESAEKLFEEKEFETTWRERINALPESLKTVMKLHITGMTQVQIAKKLGISQGSVSGRLNKARSMLYKYKIEDFEYVSLEACVE